MMQVEGVYLDTREQGVREQGDGRTGGWENRGM